MSDLVANDVGKPAATPPLAVRHLSVSLRDRGLRTRIVDDVSFDLGPRERIAVVGESGSGKTMTALAIMGLLDRRIAEVEGEVAFGNQVLTALSSRAMQRLRGPSIAYIPQDPMGALNPFFTVGSQLAAVVRSHEKVSRQVARDRALEALRSVGIPNPKRVHGDYPHQLSGGMLQRCAIAAALICHPRVVIADEPTTSLDVTIQAQIFDLLGRRADEEGLALVLITHDLGVVSTICSRVLTMYAGEIVEAAPIGQHAMDASHPYTTALLECAPSISPSKADTDLFEIPGESPNPGGWPPGCRFAARCPLALDRCRTERQTMTPIQTERMVRCWRIAEGEKCGSASHAAGSPASPAVGR